METEQEKYYREKNRKIQTEKDKQYTSLMIYGAIGLLLIITAYIVFLFVFSPGVVLAYLVYKSTASQIGAGPLWFIAIFVSASVFFGFYLLNKYDFKASVLAYFVLCGIISLIAVGLYVFKFQPIRDLPDAFWPLRSGPVEVVDIKEPTKASPTQSDTRPTDSSDSGKSAASAPASTPTQAEASTPTAASTPLQSSTPVPASIPALAPLPTTSSSSTDSHSITASFDCTQASNEAERLICSDTELAKLDMELNQAYSRARDVASDKGKFRSEQNAWIKVRRNFCAEKACLIDAYRQRIAQLK